MDFCGTGGRVLIGTLWRANEQPYRIHGVINLDLHISGRERDNSGFLGIDDHQMIYVDEGVRKPLWREAIPNEGWTAYRMAEDDPPDWGIPHRKSVPRIASQRRWSPQREAAVLIRIR